jgi:hypothetical protein
MFILSDFNFVFGLTMLTPNTFHIFAREVFLHVSNRRLTSKKGPHQSFQSKVMTKVKVIEKKVKDQRAVVSEAN